MSSRFFENSFSRSLGIHLLLLLLAFIYITQFSKPFSQWIPPIEVSFVDKKEEIVPPKSTASDDKTQRVVERSEGELSDVAKKNAYLGDKTRVVKEEQSARNSGELAVMPGHLTPKVNPAPKAQPKPVTLSELGVKIAPAVQKQFSDERNWADAQTGEAVKGGEYIAGMKEGEVSALNTKESIFFSYFNRVRQQLDQTWPSILRENIAHIYRVGRRLASNTDFTTKTVVTLNGKGEIVSVQIIEESGTHDLDQAAIDGLNKAGPYPHPPKGLIDGTGMVHIRWDFILKT